MLRIVGLILVYVKRREGVFHLLLSCVTAAGFGGLNFLVHHGALLLPLNAPSAAPAVAQLVTFDITAMFGCLSCC